jgi:hypothetical protein
MSRLGDITANPILRNFAQGAAQTAVKPVADFLAPTVSVPTMIGRYKKYTQKNRFKVPNTKRGLGGRAVRLSFDAQDEQYNCTPNALDFPIDNLEALEAEQLMSMAKYGAGLIADVATLSHELDVITGALDALGAGTNYDFTNAEVDPISVLDAAILATIKAAMNGAPVRVLFGASAFLDLKNNPLVKQRFVVGQGAPLGLVSPTLDQVSQLLFGNPKVMMTTMVQDTAAEGLTPNVQFILDKKVIVFAANDTPNTMDPSFMKTFRLDGQWMVPGSYTTEDQRSEVLKMDWSEQVQVTNTAAGTLINDHA